MFSFVYRRHSSLQRRLSVLINFSSVICLTNSFSIITRSLCAKHCIQNSSMVADNNYISHQAQWQETKAGQPLESGFSGLAWATYQDPDSKINKRKQKLYMKNSTCGKQTANSGNNLTVSVSKATVTSDAQKVNGRRERTFRKEQTLPSKDLHLLLLQVFFLLLGSNIKISLKSLTSPTKSN